MTSLEDRAIGLLGPAKVRGSLWGREVWRRYPGRRWPADDHPRMRAEAVRRVRDLVGSRNDAELLELLVTTCIAAARAEYTNPTPRIGTRDVYD